MPSQHKALAVRFNFDHQVVYAPQPQPDHSCASSLADHGDGSGCAISMMRLEGAAAAGYCFGPRGRSVHHKRSLWWLLRRHPSLLDAQGDGMSNATSTSTNHASASSEGKSSIPDVGIAELLDLATLEMALPLVPHYVAVTALQSKLLTSGEAQDAVLRPAKYDVVWDQLLVPLTVFGVRACLPADSEEGSVAQEPLHTETSEAERVLGTQHRPLSSRVRYSRADETALHCLAVLMRDLRSGSASSLFRAFVDSVLTALDGHWPLHLAYSVNGARALCASLFYACTVHRASVTCILGVLRPIHHFLSAHATDATLEARSVSGLETRQRQLLAQVIHARCDSADSATEAFAHLLILFVHLSAVVEHRLGEAFYLSDVGAGSCFDDVLSERSSLSDEPRCTNVGAGERPDSVRSDPSTVPRPVERPRAAPLPAPVALEPLDPLRDAIDRVLQRLKQESSSSLRVRVSSSLWKHRRLAQWLGCTQYAEGEFSDLLLSDRAVAAWGAVHGSGPIKYSDRARLRAEHAARLHDACGGRSATQGILHQWGSREMRFAH